MPEALPDLGAVAAVAILLIIAAGLWVLQKLLGDFFGRIPIAGPWISRNIGGGLNDARNAVLHAAGATWGFAKQLFNWMSDLYTRTVGSLVNFAAEVGLTFGHLATVTLPGIESRVQGVVLGWIDAAVVRVDSAWNAAVAQVRGDVTAVRLVAQAWYHDALSYARGLVSAAETGLTAQVRAAETAAAADVAQLAGQTQAAVSQLGRDITAGVASAESLAFAQVQALQRGIYTDLDTWGTQAVEQAWPSAIPDIQALRGVLGADFPWLNDLLGALGGLGVAGLAGALIRSMASAQAVTRLATDCVVPNCRNLSPLGQMLSLLAGTLGADLLFLLLAEMVADPAAAAADMEASLGGIVADGITLTQTLLGA
jgi:hypothetical protein